MKVEPECGFLGQTENIYSIPPELATPDPAFILNLF